ncbi:unnamed protein product, partial [Iphiclides podalirius]
MPRTLPKDYSHAQPVRASHSRLTRKKRGKTAIHITLPGHTQRYSHIAGGRLAARCVPLTCADSVTEERPRAGAGKGDHKCRVEMNMREKSPDMVSGTVDRRGVRRAYERAEIETRRTHKLFHTDIHI